MLKNIVLAALSAAVSIASADYTSWGEFKEITVTTTGVTTSDLARFPLLIRLGADNADVFSQSRGSGADLRFSAADGSPLAYQIEQWDGAGKQAAVWVSADIKGNSKVTLRMYWNKAGAADSSDGAAVFGKVRGYQAVWHLDPALSEAGNGLAAAQNHGSSDAAGIIGRGRTFNGTDAFVNLGNPAGLNIAGVITLESWARWLNGGISGTQGRRHILTHGNGTAGLKTETALRLLQDKYFAGSYNGTSKVEAAATSPIAGDSAAWVHLAGVYDGTAWRLYRNGAEVATKANAQGALASDSGWFLGSWAGTARFFSGDIDEVRVSNVVRSPDWIKLEYATQKSGQTAVVLGQTQTVLTAVAPAADSREFTFTAPGARLSFPAPLSSLHVTVADMAGRAVWSSAVEAGGGASRSRWDGAVGGRAAPAGPYVLRLVESADEGRAIHQEVFTLRP
jgi:hypothetical protein